MRKGSFFIKTDDCKIEPLKIPDELIAIHPENYSRLFSFKSIFIETNRFIHINNINFTGSIQFKFVDRKI